MKIIKGNRCSGKTMFLIKYCYQNNCIFLVPSNSMKRLITNQSKKMAMNIVVATIEDFKKLPNLRQRNVVIDELEYFLYKLIPLSNIQIDLVTCGSGVMQLSDIMRDEKPLFLRRDFNIEEG